MIELDDDTEEDLYSSTETIVRFLNRFSKHCKIIKEIDVLGESLSSTLYKIVGSEEEITIQVPKKIANNSDVAFLDTIYQT